MNNDAEAIKQLFAWLLHELDPATSVPSGKESSHEASANESGVFHSQSILDSLDSSRDNSITPGNGSSSFPFRQISSLEFGEIPAVQDRFQALLKRRLRAEIERNPPRFPWETGAFDYDSYVDVSDSDLIPAQVWMSQIHSLNLPVPLPERVLTQLFEQCREVVVTSLQEGAKLVRAVESLFPGQHQALNQLAGLVLSAPPRSGRSTLQVSTASTATFPSHYDVATPAQQMALSLLAAQEILKAMTLRLSPRQNRVQRDWLTDWGVLKLEAEYYPQRGQVRIQAALPHPGQLCLQTAIDRSVVQSFEPGRLMVEMFDLEPHQTCFLEVQLGDAPSLLTFAVCLTADE